MHKLTLEQIQDIEKRLLIKYDLKYEAMRNELLDHIACEIEEKMNQGVSYSVAFKLILSKWHKNLQPSSFNGYQKIPRFIAKRLIQTDLRFQVVIILGLMVLLLIVGEWSILVKISSFLLLIASWGLSRWYLHQVKDQGSYAVVYYRTQIQYLGYLNGGAVLLIPLLFGWLWNTPALIYGATTIWFSSCLLFAYNTYFSYRLYQFKETIQSN